MSHTTQMPEDIGAQCLSGSALIDEKRYPRRLIHQSSLEPLDPTYRPYTETWISMHPGATYVWWSREDNEYLMDMCFLDLKPCYKALHTDEERLNLLRLLYMYQFGGIFADTRLSAETDVFASLNWKKKTTAVIGILLDDSTFPHCTVHNHVLVSRVRKHMYWKLCADELAWSMQDDGRALPHLSVLRNHPFTSQFVHMCVGAFLTGAPVLERVWMREIVPEEDCATLCIQDWFDGPVAVLHKAPSPWQPYVGSAMIMTTMLALLIAVVLVSVLRKRKKKTLHSQSR